MVQGVVRVARLAVVGVWIALLVALARPLLPVGSTHAGDAVPAAAPASDDDEWMGLYMADHKIGYSHSRMAPDGNGYRLEDTSYMRLSVLDQVQTVTAVTTATTGGDYALRSF